MYLLTLHTQVPSDTLFAVTALLLIHDVCRLLGQTACSLRRGDGCNLDMFYSRFSRIRRFCLETGSNTTWSLVAFVLVCFQSLHQTFLHLQGWIDCGKGVGRKVEPKKFC